LADIEIARSDLIRLEAEATAEKRIFLSSNPQRDIPDLIARMLPTHSVDDTDHGVGTGSAIA
jgi:hypothetical protein